MEKNISEIRDHIRAVSETRQITNAMYLLSASRMKKIMPEVDYLREYYHRIRAAGKDILSRSPALKHPYLDIDETRPHRPAYLVIAADKGMAGAYNHNVLEHAWRAVSQEPDAYLATIGIYADEFFVRRGRTPDRNFLGLAQNPTLEGARMLKEELFALYDAREISELNIVYTRFVNTATQYPRSVRLLPLMLGDMLHVDLEFEYDREMIYHPSPEQVFYEIVPQYAVGLLYGTMAQSYASEHCARMNAMQSATHNADALIEKLHHAYHAARQLGITQELTETVAAGLLTRQ